MSELLKKAIEFLKSNNKTMREINNLFSAKPKKYFDEVLSREDLDRTMQIFPKDRNGQAASPINNNIKGKFKKHL